MSTHSAVHGHETPDPSSQDPVRATFADLVQAPHVAAHMEDGTLLVFPSTGALLALNSTGALIYRELLNAQSPQAIAETLTNQFHISGDRAVSDVEAFLASRPATTFGGITLATDDSPFRFAISREGFVVTRNERVCIEIDRAGRAVTISPKVAIAEAREAVLWVTPKLAALQGIPLLHASAVRFRREGAIAFAGRSGAGKTTLARAFASAGATLLCEDSCALLLEEPNGTARLIPFEPPAVRWVDEVLAATRSGGPVNIALPAPDVAQAIPIERVLLMDRRRRAGRDLVTAPIGPTAAAGELMVNLFWAALDGGTCARFAKWATTLAGRVTVEELTAPLGLDRLADAARAFASAQGT